MTEVMRIEDQIKSSYANGVMVIGDVHGNIEKFKEMVEIAHKKMLYIVSVGDIIDYGTANVECIKLMSKLFIESKATMVLGNHESKFIRYMKQYKEGKIRVQVKNGIVKTVEEVNQLSDEDIDSLFYMFNWMLDRTPLTVKFGNVTVSHAAVHKSIHSIEDDKMSGYARNYALFGEVDKDTPKLECGFPNRIYNWVEDIPKDDIVIVGHAILDHKPVIKESTQGGKAYFIDTGCSKFFDPDETIEGSLSGTVLIKDSDGNYKVDEIITI